MRADLPCYQELLRETQQTLSEKLTTSPKEAARWVEAAAHNGSKPAIISWGQMLLDGYGVERDCSSALRWFTIAAQTGYPDAINMVGRCYEHGWGTERDTQEAARCYNLAAGMGHDWARFNLGMLFIAEDGIGRDLKRALGLFVGAARQGNAKAMNMIGRYCEEGWVGRIKLDAAARWYGRAAVRGCFRGQFHLARFYAASGNFVEAAGWLRHSMANAPPDFCQDVAELLSDHHAESMRDVATLARERSGHAQGLSVRRPLPSL